MYKSIVRNTNKSYTLRGSKCALISNSEVEFKIFSFPYLLYPGIIHSYPISAYPPLPILTTKLQHSSFKTTIRCDVDISGHVGQKRICITVNPLTPPICTTMKVPKDLPLGQILILCMFSILRSMTTHTHQSHSTVPVCPTICILCFSTLYPHAHALHRGFI